MADVTPFSFQPGSSILHRLDARCKFFMICLISMSMLSAHIIACFFYFSLLIFFLKDSGLSLSETLSSLKYFLVLLIFVFLARAFTQKGDILFSFYGLSLTRQGLNNGFLVAFKFFSVMVTGLVFACTTRPSHIKSAVQWFIKPVPFVPEKRVAVMVSLSLKFIPVIARQARSISDAHKARCGHLEKNPVKKIIRMVLPLLKKTFLCADNIILAMESRCYSDDRTDAEFTPSGMESFFLAGSLAISLGFIYG